MTESIRSFIAVCSSKEIEEKIAGALWALRKFDFVKWVNEDALHITLRFLGYVDHLTLMAAKEIIYGVPPGLLGFSVKLRSIGAFPSLRSPKVFWIGVDEGAEELKRISGFLEQGLAGLPVKQQEREFVPHLTLGRLKKYPDKNSADSLTRLLGEIDKYKDLFWGGFQVSRIILFKSTLTPEGVVYEKLN